MAIARELLDTASGLLDDPRNVQWSRSELLRYLNEGLRDLVPRVPAQFALVATISLAAGVTQNLPADGVALLDVRKDVGTGRTPRRVNEQDLGTFNPGWKVEANGPTRQWMYSPEDPKVFSVAPPAVALASLEIEYGAYPAEVTNDDEMPVDQAFYGAVVDYMCFRAHQKDADYANLLVADKFYAVYLEKVGGKPPESR